MLQLPAVQTAAIQAGQRFQYRKRYLRVATMAKLMTGAEIMEHLFQYRKRYLRVATLRVAGLGIDVNLKGRFNTASGIYVLQRSTG